MPRCSNFPRGVQTRCFCARTALPLPFFRQYSDPLAQQELARIVSVTMENIDKEKESEREVNGHVLACALAAIAEMGTLSSFEYSVYPRLL